MWKATTAETELDSFDIIDSNGLNITYNRELRYYTNGERVKESITAN